MRIAVALLDLDLFAFRCAASAEQEESSEVAILRCDKWLRDTLNELDYPIRYLGFLTGKDNFRRVLYPDYKANRTQPKPHYLEEVRQFLVNEWEAVVCEGREADDLLGIYQTKYSVIVSNDKDLLQIPGQHYNPVRKEFNEVGHYEGRYNFWQQMLSGDKSDNVPGYDGVFRGSVPKFITKMMSDMEDFETEIFDLYQDKTQFFVNYNLLHIWRRERDYQCPQIIRNLLTGLEGYKPEADLTLESLVSIKNYLNQLSENGLMELETGISVPGTQMEGT